MSTVGKDTNQKKKLEIINFFPGTIVILRNMNVRGREMTGVCLCYLFDTVA